VNSEKKKAKQSHCPLGGRGTSFIDNTSAKNCDYGGLKRAVKKRGSRDEVFWGDYYKGRKGGREAKWLFR